MMAQSGEPLIVLDGVDKWFGSLHVLRDVHLTVDRGEVVVVIGPSGSGKSTLCRVINRLEPIDSGTECLIRHPLRRLDVNGMKSLLSVLDVKANRIYNAVGAGKRIRD